MIDQLRLFGSVLLVAVITLAACGPDAPTPAPAGPGAPPPIPTDVAQPGQADESSPEGGGDQPASEEPAGPTPTVDINCTETNPHPVGQSIADTYGRTYEEVMTWFCLGDTFDDILLALETSDQTGLKVEDLLDRNREIGWDAVWEELGIPPIGE